MLAQLPKPGTLFAGRYEIESLIDVGGFARVYLATDLTRDIHVALKLISPKRLEAAGLNEAEKRFYREARLISRLRSPNTVRLLDYGRTTDAVMFLSFEFIEGATLDEVLAERGPMSEEHVRSILIQILRSIHEAHSFDVLHRDIKPSNVMVRMGGNDPVKVIDFGIAKSVAANALEQSQLTREGTVLGTLAYMSPEQVVADRLGPPSDLYSIGLIGYEMLVGRSLYAEGVTMAGRLQKLQDHEVPQMVGISDEIRAVVNRLLRRNPADRFQTAQKVLASLGASVVAEIEQTRRVAPLEMATTASFPILWTPLAGRAATTITSPTPVTAYTGTDVDRPATDPTVAALPSREKFPEPRSSATASASQETTVPVDDGGLRTHGASPALATTERSSFTDLVAELSDVLGDSKNLAIVAAAALATATVAIVLTFLAVHG